MRFARVVVVLALAAVTASCESLGGGLDVVNETDQALFIVERIPPDGGRWQYTVNDCTDADLEVTAKDGAVFAELTERWCPGQTWTILGKDEYTLEDD